MTDKKLALVLGSSRGVGAAIHNSLTLHLSEDFEVPTISSKDVDTSNISSVMKFIKKYESCDVLVFNTGGPPPKKFLDISSEELKHYHNQLFVSFALMLQNIGINRGGYIFLVSSALIKEPKPEMILSQAYRTAAWSMLKALSKTHYAEREVSCIGLALDVVLTDRLRELNPDIDALKAKQPMKRVGDPAEVGKFVSSIVSKKIKHLSGQMITIDGARSTSLF